MIRKIVSDNGRPWLSALSGSYWIEIDGDKKELVYSDNSRRPLTTYSWREIEDLISDGTWKEITTTMETTKTYYTSPLTQRQMEALNVLGEKLGLRNVKSYNVSLYHKFILEPGNEGANYGNKFYPGDHKKNSQEVSFSKMAELIAERLAVVSVEVTLRAGLTATREGCYIKISCGDLIPVAKATEAYEKLIRDYVAS